MKSLMGKSRGGSGEGKKPIRQGCERDACNFARNVLRAGDDPPAVLDQEMREWDYVDVPPWFVSCTAQQLGLRQTMGVTVVGSVARVRMQVSYFFFSLVANPFLYQSGLSHTKDHSFKLDIEASR